MADHRQDSIEQGYICGRCGLEQEYLPSESPPKVCRDCSWVHGTRKPDTVPTEFKYPIS
jgi:hypothetical protein